MQLKDQKDRAPLKQLLHRLSIIGGSGFSTAIFEDIKEAAEDENRMAVLKKKLSCWANLLLKEEPVAETCSAAKDQMATFCCRHLKEIMRISRQLEITYRSLAVLLKNAGTGSLENIVLLNASAEQLTDPEDPRFTDKIEEGIRKHNKKIGQGDNFTLIVIPGYLRSKEILDRWGEIAYHNKAILVTDYYDLGPVKDILDMFKGDKLAGEEIYRSNIVMVYNYLLARRKITAIGEEEDLYIPASVALAGQMFRYVIPHMLDVKSYGSIEGVEGTRWDLKRSELFALEKAGLIPIFNKAGKIATSAACTLYQGNYPGHRQYGAVRLFDYITKAVIHIVDKNAFQIWTAEIKSIIRTEILELIKSIEQARLIEYIGLGNYHEPPLKENHISLVIPLELHYTGSKFMLEIVMSRHIYDAFRWEIDDRKVKYL